MLRAFGAFSVMLMHCIWLGPWDLPRAAFVWFHHGWLGVDLFLIISGFATTSALQSLLLQGRDKPFRYYWLSRLARIAPLYVLTSIVFLVVIDSSALTGSDWLFQLLTHVTFTHGLFPSTAGSINGVTWTLSLEIQLYIAGFIAFIFYQRKLKPIRFDFILIVFAVGISFRLWVYHACVSQNDMTFVSHWITQMPGLCEGFFLGMMIAVRRKRDGELLSAKSIKLLFLFGFLLTMVLVLLLEASRLNYWKSWHFPVLFRPAIAISLALVVWAAVHVSIKARIWLKPVAQLGVYSYGIYLWHLPALLFLKKLGLAESGLFFCDSGYNATTFCAVVSFV